MPLEVVGNKHSPACSDLCAAIGSTCEVGMEGVCQGQVTVQVYVCGVWRAPGAVSTLHLLYVLAMCMCCGAWRAPGAVSTLHLSYELAICVCCGAWRAPGAVSAYCTCYMCWLYVKWGAWRAPV